MNYRWIVNQYGVAEMTWEQSTDISTAILTSINIPYGSIIDMPTFGLNLSGMKKITSNTVDLMKDRVMDTLQWIIDIGNAKSIDVETEQDLQNTNRINIRVDAIQANGDPVSVEVYQTVGEGSV